MKKVINYETISYLFFGAATTLISFFVYNACVKLNFNVLYSNSTATIIAVTFAFITNKIFVFKSKSKNLLHGLFEFFKFILGRLFTFIVETLLLIYLVDMLTFNEAYSKALSSVIVIVLNYAVSKLTVFKKEK